MESETKPLSKQRIGKALPDDLLMDIPARLVRPAAVLFDKQKEIAVYVTEIEGSERRGKLVVEVGFTRRGQVTISGGLVPVSNLRDQAQYEVISDEL